jgi:hypothetical protein
VRGSLSFDLPQERDEFEDAQHGWKYKSQLQEIWERLFRPYHKHGYGKEIDDLLLDPNARKLLEYLESQYQEILRD